MIQYDKIGTGRDEQRQPLYRVVPLNIPFSVGITVSDFCNFHCRYCEHASEAVGVKSPKNLSFEEFRLIAAQLEEWYDVQAQHTRTKVLRMWGLGEPLINPALPDMIAYAKAHGLADRIEVTTNASLLTEELSQHLIDAGLTRLIVSIQGMSEEKYRDICRYPVSYPKLMQNLQYFFDHRKDCKVFIKTADVAVSSEQEKTAFYETFGSVCDTMNIEHIFPAFDDVDYEAILPEFDGTTRYRYQYQKKEVCDSLFSLINIQTNGDVDVCGCKFPPLVIGNLYQKPLKEIWNGKVHRAYMEKHLTGRYRTLEKCRHCASMQLNGHPADVLDGHQAEILARLEKIART